MKFIFSNKSKFILFFIPLFFLSIWWTDLSTLRNNLSNFVHPYKLKSIKDCQTNYWFSDISNEIPFYSAYKKNIIDSNFSIPKRRSIIHVGFAVFLALTAQFIQLCKNARYKSLKQQRFAGMISEIIEYIHKQDGEKEKKCDF